MLLTEPALDKARGSVVSESGHLKAIKIWERVQRKQHEYKQGRLTPEMHQSFQVVQEVGA